MRGGGSGKGYGKIKLIKKGNASNETSFSSVNGDTK